MKIAYDQQNDMLTVVYMRPQCRPLSFEDGHLVLHVDPVNKVLTSVTVFDFSHHQSDGIPSPDDALTADMIEDCDCFAGYLSKKGA